MVFLNVHVKGVVIGPRRELDLDAEALRAIKWGGFTLVPEIMMLGSQITCIQKCGDLSIRLRWS